MGYNYWRSDGIHILSSVIMMQVFDYFNHDNANIYLDGVDNGGVQNIQAYNGEEKDGYTSIKFRRSFETCEKFSDVISDLM